LFNVLIPGYGKIQIRNIVFDLNGTISFGGYIVEGLKSLIKELKDKYDLDFYILSADTRKNLHQISNELNINPVKLAGIERESIEKANFINRLGKKNTIAFGNGRNDQKMLKEAEIGILVLGNEGISGEAIQFADIIVTSPLIGLSLFLDPKKLIATLRD